MPVTSFVPAVLFVWPAPPEPVQAPAPKSALPPPKLRKKGRRRTPKPKRRVIPVSCRTILIDRLEAAIDRGLIELCAEEMECTSLDFTLAELALLQQILIPEEYLAPKKKVKKATGTAPASAERIAEYAARRADGRELYSAKDAGPVHKGRQIVVAERKNGSGVRVVGWNAPP